MAHIILESERYYLRSLQEDDATERYLSWLHDIEVSRTLEIDGQSQTIL